MAENARLFMKLSKRSSSELIAGEAVVTEFAGQIELEQWSWDISRERGDGSRSGDLPLASHERIKPQPFKFEKYLDRSTPSILAAMVANDLLKAEIVLEEAAEVDFRLVVLLDKVRVLDYEIDTDVEDTSGRAQERWTFDYESLQFNYNGSGTAGASTVRIERVPSGPGVVVPRSAAARSFLDFVAWREAGKGGAVDWKSRVDGRGDWKRAATAHDS